MDVRQLSALVAIADHGTFSGAARALYTVQSNVSGHVTDLDHARSTLASRLARMEQGEDPSPAVEQFVPAVLGAL